jgi:hypothetical protein
MCDRFKYFWTHLHKVYDFKTVVSSTWRNFLKTPENTIDLFETNEVPILLHPDWKTGGEAVDYDDWVKISDGVGYPCSRLHQVESWLSRHPEVKNWIALDDQSSGYSMYRALVTDKDKYNDKLILVDEDRGLGQYDMRRIITIMKGWM